MKYHRYKRYFYCHYFQILKIYWVYYISDCLHNCNYFSWIFLLKIIFVIHNMLWIESLFDLILNLENFSSCCTLGSSGSWQARKLEIIHYAYIFIVTICYCTSIQNRTWRGRVQTTPEIFSLCCVNIFMHVLRITFFDEKS